MRFPGQPVLAGSEQTHKPHSTESHPPPHWLLSVQKRKLPSTVPVSLPPDCLRGQWLSPSMRAHKGSGELSIAVGLGETLPELETKATMREEGVPLAQLST